MTSAPTPAHIQRPRRLRAHPVLRELVAETEVQAKHLVTPYFVLPSSAGQEAIAAMPGVSRLGRDALVRSVEQDLASGLRTVLLFGLAPHEHKDARGTPAHDPAGATPEAIRALRKAFGDDLFILTDVCLCGFTDHGHCGTLRQGHVDNDATLPQLARVALAHAQAGANWVAPSDMMDGRVGYLRARLDEAGYTETGILSYAVKYASSYYGPFRDAAASAPGKGDRTTYQMDVRNVRSAERETGLDQREGADALIVKPALAYLDVIARVRARTSLPIFAYNVSGEYAMVRAAAERGWIDEAAVVRENLLAMRRAGANAIITYHGRAAVEGGWL